MSLSLDTARTRAPCGMPKGEAKTSLEVGRPFNITWHLAYPHQGGYKLQVLDQRENFLASLTTPGARSEAEEEWVTGDTTAQAHQVTLTEECQGCSVSEVMHADDCKLL